MLFASCHIGPLIRPVAARWRGKAVVILESATRSGRYCRAGLPDTAPQFALQFHFCCVCSFVCEGAIVMSCEAGQETSVQKHSDVSEECTAFILRA
jgi:hypothetical protein